MATRMQQRRGTSTQWATSNPVLAAGEIGFETNTNKFKMGNGTSTWTQLEYFANAAELQAAIDSVIGLAPETLDTLAELAASLGNNPNFLNDLATVDSPGFTGIPTAPTADSTTNTTQVATTQFVQERIASVLGGVDGALDTLDELAAAINNDANYATTITSALATKATIVSVDEKISSHNDDTTDVHGIANTALLETTSGATAKANFAVSTHNSDTTDIHGIPDTSVLETQSGAESKVNTGISAHNSVTVNVHGIPDTSVLETVSGATAKAASAVSVHNLDITDVHGIPDTSLLETISGSQNKADAAVAAHSSDTTDVHGIANTALLETISGAAAAAALAVSTHNSDTTDVHGIADTSVLADHDYVAGAVSAAEAFATGAVSAHNLVTTNVHGILDTQNLATLDDLATSVGGVTGAYPSLAGNGLDWNADLETLDVDSTIARVSDISGHSSDTTSVHGIADTTVLVTQTDLSSAITAATVNQSLLAGNGLVWDSVDAEFDVDTTIIATKTYADGSVSTHNSDTTNVHGIADTSLLETTAGAQSKANAAAATAASALSSHESDTTNIHGIADTSILVTTTGTQTLTNKTLTNPTINSAVITATGGTPTIHGILLPATHGISFEGTTDDAFETVLTVVDPTSDRVISLPNATTTLVGKDTVDTLTNKTLTSPVINTPTGIVKADVGLSNVDNTSDANKPISTATQTALDLKAPKASPTFTGTVTSTNDLVVDGNLTVNGTTFNASSTSIVIEDNMVQLAHQNAANAVDLGLVVAYNDGAAKHSGIVRDVSDDKWRLFKGVTTEPSTTVNFGQGSLDNLAVAALEATTVTPSAGVVFSDGTQTKEGVVSRTPIIQKTASYTLSSLSERDSMIEMGSASALTLTVPTNATVAWPVGTSIDILQTGAGQVTIAPAVGVTINGTPGLKLRTTWSGVTLFKRATDTWVVYGDLTA